MKVQEVRTLVVEAERFEIPFANIRSAYVVTREDFEHYRIPRKIKAGTISTRELRENDVLEFKAGRRKRYACRVAHIDPELIVLEDHSTTDDALNVAQGGRGSLNNGTYYKPFVCPRWGKTEFEGGEPLWYELRTELDALDWQGARGDV
ncbi:hypothetical protein B5E41_30035 [Rhizobium esperanzae]|uniref:ASCH domain-containing protein n=1 Tax=Rhizobium esperanzae TaxID=1967781 RepID=A0A246DKW6_9HYPH|nr:hypothetical protein [Rhizobium esperanzae]OWO89721.1 hypothetical protein B5E41_30035 [Rhizobium esperanzae]